MFCWEPEGRYHCTASMVTSTLLVLNWTWLDSVNALLALSRRYAHHLLSPPHCYPYIFYPSFQTYLSVKWPGGSCGPLWSLWSKKTWLTLSPLQFHKIMQIIDFKFTLISLHIEKIMVWLKTSHMQVQMTVCFHYTLLCYAVSHESGRFLMT